MLNLASLYAEHNVIRKPAKGTKDEEIEPTEEDDAFKNKLYKIIPGTRPKLIISANESSCKPISDLAFSLLAIYPSKKSKTIQIKEIIKIYFTSMLFSINSKTIIQPRNRFNNVIVFGKNLKFISINFRLNLIIYDQ